MCALVVPCPLCFPGVRSKSLRAPCAYVRRCAKTWADAHGVTRSLATWCNDYNVQLCTLRPRLCTALPTHLLVGISSDTARAHGYAAYACNSITRAQALSMTVSFRLVQAGRPNCSAGSAVKTVRAK